MSDKPADVFDLDPGEYFEVELPEVKLRDTWQAKGRVGYLVRPCLEVLKTLPTVPGTVRFRSGDISNDRGGYSFADSVKVPSGWGDHVEADATLPETRVAYDVGDPVWHEPFPSASEPKLMADAVMKCGGKLGFLHAPHPTDSSYRDIVDAMAPFGICMVDGALVYDPKLAEKRFKGRRSRDKAIAALPEKLAAKKLEETRLDEEELATITASDVRWCCHSLSSALVSAGLRGLLGIPDCESCYLNTESEYLTANVVKLYDLWHEHGRHPSIFSCLPTYIGHHHARVLPVLEVVVARAGDSARKARKRAKEAGRRQPKVRVLNYLRELLAICRELYAERDSREPPFQDKSETVQSVG